MAAKWCCRKLPTGNHTRATFTVSQGRGFPRKGTLGSCKRGLLVLRPYVVQAIVWRSLRTSCSLKHRMKLSGARSSEKHVSQVQCHLSMWSSAGWKSKAPPAEIWSGRERRHCKPHLCSFHCPTYPPAWVLASRGLSFLTCRVLCDDWKVRGSDTCLVFKREPGRQQVHSSPFRWW